MRSRDSVMEKLVDAHERQVYGLLVSITRDPTLAEDLTQEVFLLAYRKGVTPGPGMRTWLREVARKLSFNELRRKRPSALGPEHLEASAADVPTRRPRSTIGPCSITSSRRTSRTGHWARAIARFLNRSTDTTRLKRKPGPRPGQIERFT